MVQAAAGRQGAIDILKAVYRRLALKGAPVPSEGFETFSLCAEGMDYADETALIDEKLKAVENVAGQRRLSGPGVAG